nr:hypothetical protein [Deltaproteobacteria bacterium]
MNRLGLALSLALAACTCPPTTHVEQTYASPGMADSIQLCATEAKCTILCSRAFALEPGAIDSCRILSLDHNGGAYVEVTWSEYVCTFDGGGDDWSSGDDGDDDYDPCSDGSCDPGDPEDYPPDEEPPDDPDNEPPPD